jgi:hypothetical protein
MLIKPFIGRVEGGDADVEDSHLSDGAVAAAGLDEDGGERLDGDPLAVQLHFSGPFQDKVYLGQLLVIVHPRILLDIDNVHRGGGIVRAGKRPFGKTARASYRVNVVKSCYLIVCHTLLLLGSLAGQFAKPKTVEFPVGTVYILPELRGLIKLPDYI